MKYTAQIRIPTQQYGYVEVTVEGTPDFIHEANAEFTQIFAVKEGLSTKEFNGALDEYLQTNSFKTPEDTFFKMNPEQQKIIQEIKKSVKRLTAKDERTSE